MFTRQLRAHRTPRPVTLWSTPQGLASGFGWINPGPDTPDGLVEALQRRAAAHMLVIPPTESPYVHMLMHLGLLKPATHERPFWASQFEPGKRHSNRA